MSSLSARPLSASAARFVGRLLLFTSLAGVALCAVGELLAFLRGEPLGLAGPGELRAIPAGILRLDGPALVHLGILVIIATPVLRVIAMIPTFLAERQPRHALVATVVLGLLVAAALIGGAP